MVNFIVIFTEINLSEVVLPPVRNWVTCCFLSDILLRLKIANKIY